MHKSHLYLLFVIFGLALTSACTKEPPAPPAPPPVAPAPASNPLEPGADAPAPPGPNGPDESAKVETAQPEEKMPVDPNEELPDESFNKDVVALQPVIDQYMNYTKKNPKDLQELVKAGYLKAVPPAPKGKKYIIDQNTFIVKEVSQ